MVFKVLELDKITKKWQYRYSEKPEKENKIKMLLSGSLVTGIINDVINYKFKKRSRGNQLRCFWSFQWEYSVRS